MRFNACHRRSSEAPPSGAGGNGASRVSDCGCLEAHFATPHFLAFSEVLLRAADGAAEFARFEVSTAAPLFG